MDYLVVGLITVLVIAAGLFGASLTLAVMMSRHERDGDGDE